MLYPLRFAPLYYDKVWGGRRLETLLGRDLPPHEPIGESWEVADHANGRSVVANGPYAGKTLHEVIAADPVGVLGTRVAAQNAETVPLLVKYIDADDKLSVQVHPDDAYAAAHAGDLGKTEMWYVLHADPGACLIAGLQPGVTQEQFRRALAEGGAASLLHAMPVQTGDSIFIPAGRIHAIMPGLVILEIQQNSDTTYRLYDWDRMGLDGKPRALHVEDALAVSNWTDYAPNPQPEGTETEGENRKTVLATCPYFVVEKYDLAASCTLTSDGGSFRIINGVGGSGTLVWSGGEEALTFGDSVLVPAGIREFQVIPNGHTSLVVSYVP